MAANFEFNTDGIAKFATRKANLDKIAKPTTAKVVKMRDLQKAPLSGRLVDTIGDDGTRR